MNGLEIVDLYEHTNDEKNKKFYDSIDSSLYVTNEIDARTTNFEWLEIMEETIRYLDNILRNPNRFIINEEDIVKIELARRVTVESIKHLSKNTNLIQDIDKKTGDVRPSKILNINKEESFDTYENRFIYSLIKNMKFYIDRFHDIIKYIHELLHLHISLLYFGALNNPVMTFLFRHYGVIFYFSSFLEVIKGLSTNFQIMRYLLRSISTL